MALLNVAAAQDPKFDSTPSPASVRETLDRPP
jgi:hypothetical protein